MTEKYLISQDDIMKFHPMSDIPQQRMDPFILKTQELDLKPILNDAFYYDFMLKFDDTNQGATYTAYQALLNGTTYTYAGQTIEFPGLKPMLCSFTLARFLPMHQVNINRYNITSKLNPQSEPVPTQQLAHMANQFKSDGLAYQGQAEQFLQQNPATYPLYGVAPTSVPGRTGVRFINSADGGRSKGFGWWDGNHY